MLTVLIADDDADVRVLMRIVLSAAGDGFSVIGEAADGEAAVRLWRELAQKRPPDVVVLDHQMPHMTGLDAAAQILRARPSQAIIICSTVLSPAIRSHAVKLGVRGCVDKTDLDALARHVEEARGSSGVPDRARVGARGAE